MTKAECLRLVRKVFDGEVSREEVGLVMGVVIEEMLLRDHDTTLAFLRSLRDEPTKH